MSYAMAEALQTAVYQRLLSDTAVEAQVGTAVFDALPVGKLPDLYISLGPEEVKDRSDQSGGGAIHRFSVSVVTTSTGFAGAKAVAASIFDALTGDMLSLNRGRVVGIWFERATARRAGTAGRVRRIDMSFRARVEDNSTT